MSGILDITPLRSLVAIADHGGFQKAADALHLSQSAVSQHVRRLEAATGASLVRKQGRGSDFTAGGEVMLGHARQILAAHDRAVAHFCSDVAPAVTIGSTEHAAAQLLPALTAALAEDPSGRPMRLQLDRGTRLRADLVSGRLDLAILPGPTAHPDLDGSARAVSIGSLELTWFAAPGWQPPGDGTVPLAVFESPCALRARAVQTLERHGLQPTTAAEAGQLAGVQAAAGAGLGVALLATLGQEPAGLRPVVDLPPAERLEFSVWAGRGVGDALVDRVVDSLRTAVLEADRLSPPAPA